MRGFNRAPTYHKGEIKMRLRESYNESIDREIIYFEERLREANKYGNEIDAENWQDLINFTLSKKVNEKEGAAS